MRLTQNSAHYCPKIRNTEETRSIAQSTLSRLTEGSRRLEMINASGVSADIPADHEYIRMAG